MNVIQIENLWKEYQLGVIGHGTLAHDLQSWWARLRGKEDPNSKILPMLKGQKKQVDGNKFWALQDINLEIKNGDILGIIGKNGAGKSTLLKILSRVTAPSRGNIKVKGRIASLLEVGTGFHPELTGRENVFLNGAILGMTREEVKGKFDEILDFSGIETFIDTPVKRYSSGMYVRLAFAVAAHLDPEILIIDEVLAVGDAAFQNRCLGKMSEVSCSGRTVLFVSHNLSAISGLCNRAVWVDDGRIKADGLTSDVITSYISSSIQQTREVNLSERLDRRGDGTVRFVDMHWEDSAGKKVKVLQSGNVYHMVLGYTCVDSNLHKNVLVSYMISDLTGNCLMLHQTNFKNQNINLTAINGRIICTLPRLPLVPGEYTLTLYLGISKQACDVIENVTRVIVEGGDYYGTGSIGRGKLCKLLFDCNWSTEI